MVPPRDPRAHGQTLPTATDGSDPFWKDHFRISRGRPGIRRRPVEWWGRGVRINAFDEVQASSGLDVPPQVTRRPFRVPPLVPASVDGLDDVQERERRHPLRRRRFQLPVSSRIPASEPKFHWRDKFYEQNCFRRGNSKPFKTLESIRFFGSG